jgi:hypothetical protein
MTITLSKLLVATTALIAVAAPVKAEIDVSDVEWFYRVYE